MHYNKSNYIIFIFNFNFMNFKSIFSAVALSALMVGCSSDDIELIPDNPTPDGGETTSGYMNIAINLPSVGSHDSRAGQENDSFDDGLLRNMP